MKARLLILGTAALAVTCTSFAQLSVNGAESGRIMSPSGPSHLGGAGTIWNVSDLNDIGDSIVGDNSGNNLNFSLVLAFDTTSAFRTYVANGGTVTFEGSALYGIPDGFGGTAVKSTGNVDWGGGIKVSVNAYGNSTVGTYSDTNAASRQAAFNLADSNSADAQTAYTLIGNLNFAGDPYVADTTFSVDITSAIAALPLDATLDRFYLGVSAWTQDLSQIASGNDFADRVAFEGSSFTVVPEPSTYAAFLGLFALVGVMIRRRFKN